MHIFLSFVVVTIFSCACSASRSPGTLACSSLVSSLGPSIIQSSDGPLFSAGAKNAWNLFTNTLTPSCVVFPTNASHVQVAMRTIFRFGANYSLQAGSHSAMTGWNNVQDGVLINFLNMTNISFDPVSDTITLEPGVHWKDAYATLEPLGVAPVGGRQKDVGTGLLLGGGLSYLSPGHGFAADNFVSLDVVLVTGELVTATANNDQSDLFRALKGGGNRFGIVTKYVVNAIHTGTNADKVFFGGVITYPDTSVDAVLNAASTFVGNVTDPKATLVTTIVGVNTPGGVQTLALAHMFYNGTSLPTDIFGAFLGIPAISKNIGPLSYLDITNIIPQGGERGFGEEFGASSITGDPQQLVEAHAHWANFTQTFISQMTLSVFVITPVPTTQIQIGRQRGGNAINPPDVNFAYLLFQQQFLPNVTTAPPEVEAGKLLLFSQVPGAPGLPFFISECDKRQNVYRTYHNFDELQQTYFKYDPSGFIIKHMDGPIGLEEGFDDHVISPRNHELR